MPLSLGLSSPLRRSTASSGLAAHQQQQPASLGSEFLTFSNAVYYPNWRIYRQQPPSSLHLEFISHVFYAFAWIKSDGTVYLSDEYADAEIELDGTQGCLRALTDLRQKYPRLKFLLSIGGGGAGSTHFPSVAASRSTRLTFVVSAKSLVDEFGLDGIDFDWEHPANQQEGHDYIQLLTALRDQFPTPYVLTSALPADEGTLRNINVAQASVYLDFMNLMAYDFAGPWTELSGHHAQLYTPHQPHSDAALTSCVSSTTYLLSKGVPARKILLGVPTYGRSFLGVSGIGERYRGHAGEEGTFDYKDLPRPGAQEHVDENSGAAYCIGGDGGFVTYDNPQTVRLKARFAVEQSLGGLFYWTGTADVRGPRSLVETGCRTLHRQV